MGALSPGHWAIVAVVLLVLFGSKKLPDAARGLGRSLRILKSEVGELQADDQSTEVGAPESAKRLSA
ncbi:Sec-independent protein translocase subunit TatA [Rhodococcus sp. TAF43]|uniref:Sec-independent protein translocase subunit TatA n=1 Tax=unclassified Rhodococcus (in: high G+C Gram-positive bacteria) TaxID=192944 RepID=UPI001581E3D2|nr:Sec-independent protein translocase subunit TatA [Rhodococcus sp. W8901]QKT09368.1 Sec-independent protein translocase subunit TatA [Rhodococcus sp. W8901]